MKQLTFDWLLNVQFSFAATLDESWEKDFLLMKRPRGLKTCGIFLANTWAI